eukprot:TRINITY_DN2845_c0_g1_i7.p1 TRINITY_DN2845_c0_g1~~TRINITY_DN2845_c0_g1_i7.p1  ORF type:complete len:206 (+),score=36.29 TRINITY_DN2845_c0_g1_i7:52-618(+)
MTTSLLEIVPMDISESPQRKRRREQYDLDEFKDLTLLDLPPEILLYIFDRLRIQDIGRMASVCKTIWDFLSQDNWFHSKFIKRELWYKCAPKPEKSRYSDYRSALASTYKQEFALGQGVSRVMHLNPEMSMRTLHLILCALGYLPPYKTVLYLTEADFELTIQRVESVSNLLGKNYHKCISVNSTVLR